MEIPKVNSEEVQRAVEEEREAIQLALRGVWTKAIDGCPHRIGKAEGPSLCSDDSTGDGLFPCVYEVEKGASCDVLKAIIREWQEEYDLKETSEKIELATSGMRGA